MLDAMIKMSVRPAKGDGAALLLLLLLLLFGEALPPPSPLQKQHAHSACVHILLWQLCFGTEKWAAYTSMKGSAVIACRSCAA
jgi:hypothetical protein